MSKNLQHSLSASDSLGPIWIRFARKGVMLETLLSLMLK